MSGSCSEKRGCLFWRSPRYLFMYWLCSSSLLATVKWQLQVSLWETKIATIWSVPFRTDWRDNIIMTASSTGILAQTLKRFPTEEIVNHYLPNDTQEPHQTRPLRRHLRMLRMWQWTVPKYPDGEVTCHCQFTGRTRASDQERSGVGRNGSRGEGATSRDSVSTYQPLQRQRLVLRPRESFSPFQRRTCNTNTGAIGGRQKRNLPNSVSP